MKEEIEIGEYKLSKGGDYPNGDKSIWIQHENGEGGQFPERLLASTIQEFYNKYF